MNLSLRVGLAALTLLPVTVLSQAPAHAACDYTYVWEFSNIDNVHRKFPGNTFKDGPGGTMSVSVEEASTVQSSVSATIGGEAGPPLWKVKAEVTRSAVKSKTTTLGHHYSHKIPAGKYGHLAYGSWAKKFTYKKVGRAPYCPTQVVARGKAVYPTTSLGWRFWATNS